MLEKILYAYPGIPTLNNVVEIAKRHEDAKKNSQVAKTEIKGAFAILGEGQNDSESESASDDSSEVFFIPKKGTGQNRNYFVRITSCENRNYFEKGS